jgi:glycosyltransferase involved in cell wall biosynthesis
MESIQDEGGRLHQAVYLTVMKPGLTLYTNMPTPYQLDFFDALKQTFNLTVVYFTSREQDRLWELETEGEGYTAYTLDNSSWISKFFARFNSVHFSPSIFKMVVRDPNKYVIVNGTYWSPNVMIALIAGKLRGKTMAFWTEALFRTDNVVKRLLKKVSLLPLSLSTNFLMAIGKGAAESFREYGYKKPAYIIPYSINVDLYMDQALDRDLMERLTTSLALEGKVVFLSSGALIARKGMDTLIHAFKGIKDENCSLIIMGDGPERDNLEQIIGDDNRIHIIGFQTKGSVPSVFRLADVFVFASRYDGWGLVINEACAAGCAIICSNAVGAVTDRLMQDNAAIVCAVDDSPAFQREMDLLIRDSVRLDKYKEHSSARARYFSSTYCAEQVFNIFMEGGANIDRV